jgi:alpha-tubulin suppressor-like RCC1 family protein
VVYQWGDGVQQPRKIHFAANNNHNHHHARTISTTSSASSSSRIRSQSKGNTSDMMSSSSSSSANAFSSSSLSNTTTSSEFRKAHNTIEVIRSISAGRNHFAAVSEHGIVYTWGISYDSLGQSQPSTLSTIQSGGGGATGTGTGTVSTPQIVEALLPENCGSEVIQIASAGNRSCAITEYGDLYSWGMADLKVSKAK